MSMDQAIIEEAVGTAVSILSDLESAKDDAKTQLSELYETYGCSKAERKAIKKVAMARIKGKVDDLVAEIAADEAVIKTA